MELSTSTNSPRTTVPGNGHDLGHDGADGRRALARDGLRDFGLGDQQAERLELAERGDEHGQGKHDGRQPERGLEAFLAETEVLQPARADGARRRRRR